MSDFKEPEVRLLGPADEYFIDFKTKDVDGSVLPNCIEAVRVRLDYVRITDMGKSFRIDLADHPLYNELQKNVKANPR